jgi:hypothetical protein
MWGKLCGKQKNHLIKIMCAYFNKMIKYGGVVLLGIGVKPHPALSKEEGSKKREV